MTENTTSVDCLGALPQKVAIGAPVTIALAGLNINAVELTLAVQRLVSASGGSAVASFQVSARMVGGEWVVLGQERFEGKSLAEYASDYRFPLPELPYFGRWEMKVERLTNEGGDYGTLLLKSCRSIAPGAEAGGVHSAVRLRITAPGGISDNLVITDMLTGAQVNQMVAVKELTVHLRHGQPVSAAAVVEMFEPDLEVERFDWATKHPLRPTEPYQPLAALEFRDGTRVAFREDGAPTVTEAQRLTLKMGVKFDAREILLDLARQMFGGDVPEPDEGVTVEEMTSAIAAHIRLRAAEFPASLWENVAVVRPVGPDGQPADVKPADFWTWLRPASIDRTVAGLERTWATLGTAALPAGPDASVRIERGAEGRYHVSAGPHSWRGEGIDPALSVAAAALTSAVAGVQASDINACGDSQPAAYVTIQRWGANYDASTGPDATGMSTGLTGQVDINAALAFARQHLTPGAADEVVHPEPAAAA